MLSFTGEEGKREKGCKGVDMDKEKDWEQDDSEADYTGYSEKKSDKAVDMAPGQWTKMSGKTIFSKKQTMVKANKKLK